MSACIETTNSRDRRGYGKTTAIRFGKKIWRTHRVAWIDANGRLPVGEVMHTCHNPPCENPEHLVEGSHARNMADMSRAGRTKNQQKTCCSICGGPFVRDRRNKRRCIPCDARRSREWRRVNQPPKRQRMGA